MENLYEILEVSPNASKEVIEKAYKVLVKRYHPDISLSKENVDDMIKKINNAYDILGNDEKRKRYDEEIYRINNMKQEQKYNQNYNPNVYEPNKKCINIDNKILVLLIIVAGIFLIISCVGLYDSIGKIVQKGNNNMNNSEIQIDTSKCNSLINNIVIGFNDWNVNTIINNITNKEYFNDMDIDIIEQNIDMYKLIISDLNVKINDIKVVSKDRAEIKVSISRNNIEEMSMQYYFSRAFGANNLTSKQEKDLLIKSINDNTKNVNISDTYIAINDNNEWKIQLNNMNVLNLLGMSISKYIDIFELIN